MESAAACLDHGLQSSNTGLLLRPVAWSLVADAVYRSCPQIADLLEKLCGRTGQKYFQLLGNSESGEPEFVGANLDALVMPKQVPAVRGILDQLYGRSQALPKQPAARAADVASTHMDDVTAGDAIQKLPDHQDQALSKPAVLDPGAEGQADGQLPSAGSQTLSAENSEATQAVQRPPVVYAPPEPSASPNSASTGSTPAMQALLSACMQVPTNSVSNNQGISKQPIWVPAAPPVPAARPASASAVASAPEPAATSAARPASAGLSAAVPFKTHSSDTLDKAAAVAANGATSVAVASGTLGSSASSSASGVSLVLKARSSASTELSDTSVPAADKDPASACQPARVNPFCLECMAQPGQCVRHALMTDMSKPMQVAIETEAPRDTHSPSDCSSQVCFLAPDDLNK